MKVLIFDTNLVFAKRVRDCLLENFQLNVEVDIATNYHILCKKLDEDYDFIIADIVSTPDMELILNEFRRARQKGKTIYTWSVAHKDEGLNLEKTAILFRKPMPNQTDILFVLSQFVTRSGLYPAILETSQGNTARSGRLAAQQNPDTADETGNG